MTTSSRLLMAVAIAMGCAAASPPPDASAAPTKRALLIGINDYRAVGDLKGCVNDVELVRALLTSRFGFDGGNVTVLTDEKATRRGILAALDALTRTVASGDVVYVHYSGHGSRMHDASGDEIDGWDETIVPHDSRTEGVFDLTDDELNALFGSIGRKAGHLAVVLDSCHSGSATRAGSAVRRVADDLREPPPGGPGRSATSEGEIRDYGAEYVLIAGCLPHELSNEHDVDGRRHGALTYTLATALRDAPAGATYRDVVDRARSEVSAVFPSQHPHLEGPHADRTLFGMEDRPRAPLFPVRPSGEGWEIEAGRVFGLAEGAELDVFPPAAADLESPIARLRIVSAEDFRSHATVISGEPRIPNGSRARLESRPFADFEVTVAFDPDLPDELTESVRTLLGEYAGLISVGPAEDAASLSVRRDGPRAFVAASDLVPLSTPHRVDDPAAARRLTDQLVGWARWLAVRSLSNAGDARVSLEIGTAAGAAPDQFAHRDRVEVRVTNESDRPLYITILDLSSDGSIAVWHPRFGAPDQLAKGKTLVRGFELFVPEGRDSVDDTIKVLATDEPLNPSVFVQAPVRSSDPRPELSADPRLAFIQATAAGLDRGGNAVPLGGWSTFARTIRIQREPSRSVAFLLHFDSPRSDLPGVRGCVPGSVFTPGDPCFQVDSYDPAGLILEARLPANPDGSRGIRSNGTAWDQAYALRRTTGAARVEPTLEVALGEWVDSDTPSVRGGIQRPDKEAAKRNPLWSLEHIRAAEAWSELRREGRPDGGEGGGVIVGHPDTGYRPHPEIWAASEDASPVLFTQGYDYYEKDDDPRDPLDGGVLANPGHGTSSGSVIVSPKGKQGAGPAGEYVSGVAPGAKLVPLRVHKSVVHFDSRRLGRAIYEAAGEDRSRVRRKPAVISISMGGLPSWALWRAVKYAEQRGVIVVAAAGNEVGFVVWPARFRETIAVAASNVDCGIWGGSSRGAAVDISAPGESVWRAATDASGAYGATPAQGTTYATATTAGVAALWLSRHAGDPRLERLVSNGEVTAAFRRILQATSWRPDGDPETFPPGVTCRETRWDARFHGPGIVDAAAVLKAALPSASGGTRSASPAGFDDLPLFATLFPDETPRETIRSRFGTLVTARNDDEIDAAAEVEGEILTVYAVDESVRAALDQIGMAEGRVDPRLYADARRELRAADISSRLRSLLAE